MQSFVSTNIFINVLEGLRLYIKKIYQLTIDLVDVNEIEYDEGTNELYGRYYKAIYDHVGEEDVVVMMHDRGTSYVAYPYLDVEVSIVPSTMQSCGKTLVMTGDCDDVQIVQMFPNVRFDSQFHRKEVKFATLIQYNISRPVIALQNGYFPSQ